MYRFRPYIIICLLIIPAQSASLSQDTLSACNTSLTAAPKELNDQFLLADQQYRTAEWMTIGGLGALIIPSFFDESDARDLLITSGFISYCIGVPLMGRAVKRMRTAALEYNSDFTPPFGGRGLFWTGKGIQLVGLSILTVGGIFQSVSFLLNTKTSDNLFTLGASTIAVGTLFDFVAWYRYGKVRKSIKSLFAESTVSIFLQNDGKGNKVPGLRLTGSF